ncbi:APC family permease [uncultured Photobacterium sp.]|uniref:APC family permease n=1 Tax=uncultured Photobacterium sp. TaxID=173973 RepID=UPI00262EA5FA|nr:APC family permease [uncultured Photobacterium sp.]
MTKQKLGLASIVLLGFNSIIGSGIFLLPSSLYQLAGDWSVALILITAIIVATIAFCFAEASGYFSQNGAAYVYTKEAFGSFAGFEVGFLKWMMQCIAWGVMAVALTNILANTFGFEENQMLRNGIIVGIVGSLTLLNLAGVGAAKVVNNISTLAKMVPLVVLIVGGIWFINPENIIPTFSAAESTAEPAQYSLTFETLGSALILCFYAFTGFETFGTAAEDMENPKRNLPLAIIIVILAVTVFYAAVMAVSVGILGPDIANSSVPLADAAKVAFGDFGFYMITIGSIISIAGINVAASFHIPRALLPLADDKMIPAIFGSKNEKGIPTVAILASGLVTIPIALSGSFTTLAMLSVVTRFAQYIPTCIATLKFRKRFENDESTKNNFKVPFGPIVPVTGVCICVWLLADQSLTKILVGLGAMVLISPLYFIARKRAAEQQAKSTTAKA